MFKKTIEALCIRMHGELHRVVTLVREEQDILTDLQNRSQALKEEIEALEDRLVALRMSSPERQYEEAMRTGFSRGFDLALVLQEEKFQEHLKVKTAEAYAKASARYEDALRKLEEGVHA